MIILNELDVVNVMDTSEWNVANEKHCRDEWWTGKTARKLMLKAMHTHTNSVLSMALQ